MTKYTKGNMVLTIEQDDGYSCNPRDWDDETKMICFHSRYALGDTIEHEHKVSEFKGFDELRDHLITEHDAGLILPLSLYDHSGLTLSIGVSNGWDSGQVGFIFVTKEYMRLNELTESNARKIMDYKLETYNQWLSGDVYRYTLIENIDSAHCNHSHEEQIDDCGGFYGSDHEDSGLFSTIDLPNFDILEWECEED